MGEILIYTAPDSQTQVEVTLGGETVWLSQKQMAALFSKDSDTIGLHIKNIYVEHELEEKSTTEVFSVVQKEGTSSVVCHAKRFGKGRQSSRVGVINIEAMSPAGGG